MIRLRNRPSGFTLIELLAVLSIVGVLMGLILPAVQSSRESARRLRCANNLKQIGLALQGYSGQFGYYPGINGPTARLASVWVSAHAYSPLARMLDLLGQAPLYNAANLSNAATRPATLWDNLTVMRMNVDLFVCPTDRLTRVAGYGRVNYSFSTGPSPWHSPGLDAEASYDGPFTVHRFYRPADFRDGLSQTVGVSERLQGDWQSHRFSRGDYLLTRAWAQRSGTEPMSIDWAVAACRSQTGRFPHESRGGESWFLSGFHFTNFNHATGPNSEDPDCSVYDFHQDIHYRTLHDGVFAARSSHTGGVTAAMMDGSVRFIRDAIALRVWRALGTRGGAEAVSSDAFE